MNIRTKTLRRLLVLLLGGCLVVGLLVGVYVGSVYRNNRAIKKLRVDAMAAYRAGDYVKSVELLQSYREKIAVADPEAEFAFGMSRIHVDLPEGKQLIEGIHVFEHYLETMKPDDSAARHELLKLYVARHYNAEAVGMADNLLEKNPSDVEVIQAKVYALIGQQKLAEALEQSQKLNSLDPLNLTAQLNTVALMSQLNRRAAEVVDHAAALQKSHPQDPRFEMLLAFAYSQTKQDELKLQWLRTAAGRTPPDATFVVDLTTQLDAAELFPEASAFLARSADQIPSPTVQRLFAQRLWEQGQFQVLADRLKNQQPTSANADGALLGYRALALFAEGKRAEARELADALARRFDSASIAWGTALRARFVEPPLNGPELVEQLKQSIARDSENPVFHTMLAEAYLRMGESELSIPESMAAFRLARSWPTPLLTMAQAMLSTGRNAEAFQASQEARKRAPERYDTNVMRAKAYFAWVVESGLRADYDKLLVLLRDIHQAFHDTDTLPLYVTALARTDHREQAVAEIRAVFAAVPAPTAATLTHLAEVAEREKLEVGDEIREYMQKTQGLSPEMALSQARIQLQSGKYAAGLEILRNAARAHEKEPSWMTAVAIYRESAAQVDAIKDWVALGEQFPSDLQVQQAILRAQSRIRDRAFWSRTIDRVKTLTGEQGLLWRIERARWLLVGDLSEKDKAAAVNLLTQVTSVAPELPEPHRLLAVAMENVKNIPGAIAELTSAADARPGDPGITRDLFRLLVANHRAPDAGSYLDKLSQNRDLSVDDRHWLARAYAELNLNEKAVDVLSGEEAGSDDIERDRMLCGLYRRVGRVADASALYKNLFDQPIVDPIFWAEGADFFASQDDMSTAEQFLKKLAALPLKPGELELVRGRFAESWQGTDEALKHYRAATTAAAQSAEPRIALVGFYIRHMNFAAAVAAVDESPASLSANDSLKVLKAGALTLSKLGNVQEYATLIDALCADAHDPGVSAMLSTLSSAQAANLSRADTARKIADVAARFPHQPALQSQAARTNAAAGLNREAAEIARRADEQTPGTAEFPRLLAGIYASLEEWPKAEQSALLWRRRAPDQALSANISLASIYLLQPTKNPAGVIAVLERYVKPGSVPQDPRVLELYERALILEGRITDAANLLKPLLADSRRCRATWLDLAAECSDPSSASKWIEQVAPLIPKDSVLEQSGLANAWYMLGVRFESAAYLDNARQIIQPWLTEGSPDSQALLVAALVAQAQNDYPTAEKLYRALLAKDPKSPDTMNNLAYLLWLEKDPVRLGEANQLAESAVKVRPDDASFYDTLARVQLSQGDPASAIHSFRVALLKDHGSLEAMIGLADLLSKSVSGREEAREIVGQIQRRLGTSPPLSATLRQQFRITRETLAVAL